MDPRTEAITELARLGWSQRRIAQAVGLTQPGVLKILRRLSLATPEDTPREAHTERAPVGDNSKTANQQTETQSEQEASTAAPLQRPEPVWEELPLHDLLRAAFQHCLRIVPKGDGICLKTPTDFPPILGEALQQHGRDLLFEINRTALRHPPCPECGNCLLFRRRGDVLCPVCQGRVLGPDWVWARW